MRGASDGYFTSSLTLYIAPRPVTWGSARVKSSVCVCVCVCVCAHVRQLVGPYKEREKGALLTCDCLDDAGLHFSPVSLVSGSKLPQEV